jgi:hypothetical protein
MDKQIPAHEPREPFLRMTRWKKVKKTNGSEWQSSATHCSLCGAKVYLDGDRWVHLPRPDK